MNDAVNYVDLFGLTSNDICYTVQPGDCVWKIADKYDCTTQQVIDNNNFSNPNLIHPGDKIYIPVATPATATDTGSTISVATPSNNGSNSVSTSTSNGGSFGSAPIGGGTGSNASEVLNSTSQSNVLNRLSGMVNNADMLGDSSTILSWFSMIPTQVSGFLGGSANILSAGSQLLGTMPRDFIDAYNTSLIESLKNYSDGKSFDNNCSLELYFAANNKYIGKENDFSTVWEMILENPNLKLSDLPDKYETEYFVTLRWKDENNKTLGGKTIKMNKAEFEFLMKIVIEEGGKSE